MTTPPSSLPSPTPSSGSSQQPNKPPPTFSSIAAQPPQTSSSTTLSTSPSTTSHNMGDHASSKDASSESYGDDVQQTPQPQSNSGYQSTSASFLPPVTASPPPHAPPYVPPAQHAMAPDPIHSLALPGQPGNVWGAGWRPGPPGGPPGAPGYAHPQGYGRGAPNGHLTHQLPPNPMEAYGPNSRQSMTSTPGPAPLGGINGSHSARSGSQSGEPRDRRRERHREEEGRDREDEEVISTIFVVGFPDDMSEREFQNIFTFAPGFEAATLKFPSGSRREPAGAAALLAELQHIAAQQNMGPQMMNPDHPDQPLDETFAAMNFGTQSSSASNTPSAAMSLTPSAPTGSTLGTSSMPQQVPPRRQTIGFARFKTRGDALAARDHLQGRRIDTLTGATLKAEMAKKNLHTKRGVAGDDLVGLLLRSGRLSQLVSQQAVQSQGIPGAPGAGLGQAASGALSGPNMALSGQNPGAAQSAKEAWDAWPAPGQASAEPKTDKLSAHQAGGSGQSNTSGSPPLSGKSPNSRPTDSKALLALAEEADELEGWSVGSVGMGGMALEQYPSAGSGGPAARSGPMPGSGAMPGSQPAIGSGGYGYAGQHGSYSSALGFGAGPEGAIDPRSLGITANMNPADQNPPINTLYIGNLPAISPPTHPPNFLEEALRSLFQRRPGFKRMSFRQKINGPMCFVEFEDIPYATQAMRELYGNTLNGLVKGGIRLSYSKNSLGQRGNSHQQAMNNATFGGIAHTVALAGMSTAPSGMPIGPGGGAPQGSYSMAASSQPVPIGPPSGNQGSNADRRGGGAENASSLSPNAQPFNAPLPTSPRSQRFYGPSSLDRQNSSGNASASSATPSQATAIPGAGGQSEAAFNSFAPSSVGGGGQGGFSPVSSPIRTPASLGWVSSSSGGPGSSNTFGAFDAFGVPHHGLSSLNGAANAWGHANSTNTSS